MPRPRTGLNGTPVNLYLPRDLKVAASKMAKLRHRASLSEFVTHLLRDAMRKKNVAFKKTRKCEDELETGWVSQC